MKVALMAWASNHRWHPISHLTPSCLPLWLAAFIMIFCTNIHFTEQIFTTNISGDRIFISTRLSQTPAVSRPGLDSLTTSSHHLSPPFSPFWRRLDPSSAMTSSPKFSPFYLPSSVSTFFHLHPSNVLLTKSCKFSPPPLPIICLHLFDIFSHPTS